MQRLGPCWAGADGCLEGAVASGPEQQGLIASPAPPPPSPQPCRRQVGLRGRRGSGQHRICHQSELGCGSKCHLYCWNKVALGRGPRPGSGREPGWGSSCLAGGCPSPGQSGPQGHRGPFGPVLGRAQDGLQVLGQGADDSLDVQPGPLQRLLLHRELVAPCPHLQGWCRSGAGGLQVPRPRLGRMGASHQFLPQLQDQVHNLHLRLALHPGLDVLP